MSSCPEPRRNVLDTSVVGRTLFQGLRWQIVTLLALMVGQAPVYGQMSSISFCDAPSVLPRAMPLSTYSPAICVTYSGLEQARYTIKVYLLEPVSGNLGSGQWGGDASSPPAVFHIDNTDGSQTNGALIEVRTMDVYDYPNFAWIADLHNEAGIKVNTTGLREATSTANRPPVLASIGAQQGYACQPLNFTIAATDMENDPLTYSAHNLPAGATFDADTRQFAWPCPAVGVYPAILFTATQSHGIPLSDAELVSIHIGGEPQVLAFSANAYRTGEAGPLLVTVTRSGGSAGTVTVDYATQPGSASAGDDYTPVAQTLTFAPGETSQTIILTINPDTNIEPDESLTVVLSQPGGGATLGDPQVATITIVDDDTPSRAGQWSAVVPWPVVPIHLHVLPDGRVLFWDRYDTHQGWNGAPMIWDPTTDQFSLPTLPDYDVFCSGHVFMADGRLFVSGGHVFEGVGENKATLYDPVTDTWTRLPEMTEGRWYPSNVLLTNGDVLVMAGSDDGYGDLNLVPQVWQPASQTWRYLTTAAQGTYPLWADYYPFLYVAPNGKVFNAGPQQMARYLDTTGTGMWTDVAPSSLLFRDYATSVMYAPGKVLNMGGTPRDPSPFEPLDYPASASVDIIDLNVTSPGWQSAASMSAGRRLHNATLLPDGKVLVTGGTSAPGFDTPSGRVMYAEMWDPATETWRILGSYTRYRGYHSVAALLPDGRVVMGGGGHFAPPGGANESNVEIFSPPYLFNGPRPTISAAPSTVGYDQSFWVATSDAASIADVTLVRLSSVTHSFNQNQRFNRLSFTPTAGGLTVIAPANANLAPPGHYMLFILNADGVPSVAHMLQVGVEPTPTATHTATPTVTATPTATATLTGPPPSTVTPTPMPPSPTATPSATMTTTPTTTLTLRLFLPHLVHKAASTWATPTSIPTATPRPTPAFRPLDGRYQGVLTGSGWPISFEVHEDGTMWRMLEFVVPGSSEVGLGCPMLLLGPGPINDNQFVAHNRDSTGEVNVVGMFITSTEVVGNISARMTSWTFVPCNSTIGWSAQIQRAD